MKLLKMSFIVLGLSIGSTSLAAGPRDGGVVNPAAKGRAKINGQKMTEHQNGSAGCNQVVNYAGDSNPRDRNTNPRKEASEGKEMI